MKRMLAIDPEMFSVSMTPQKTMPDLFSGKISEQFYAVFKFKFGYIDPKFVSLTDPDEFDGWFYAAASGTYSSASIEYTPNLYSFIKRFNIPAEVARKILISLRAGTVDDFSDEDIDVLLTGTPETVARHFAAEQAIIKGKNLYSLSWIYRHSPDDYKVAGITVEDIRKVLSVVDGADCRPLLNLPATVKSEVGEGR